MSQIRRRQLQRYDYRDPAAFLKDLRKIEPLVSLSGLDYKVRSLHTRGLQIAHERRQAALFAQGMAGRIPDFRLSFACVENSDYDAVLRLQSETDFHFFPVQLKELVPQRLNERASLEELLAGLDKYARSPDLIVAVFLNRRISLDLAKLPSINFNLGGLYFVGAAKSDQSEWYLIGDLLDSPFLTTFCYPI